MEIQKEVTLDAYTTLHIGGVADYFVVVRSEGELRDAWRAARDSDRRPFVLGGGSNVLIADGALPLFVIKNELAGIAYEEEHEGRVLVTAAAGVGWDELVAATVARGFSGLENLSGIPGTVGAAPVQNINAYGATVAEVIDSVTVYDGGSDSTFTLSSSACEFGYRDSVFKREVNAAWVVTAVTFRLVAAMHINVTYRSSSQSIGRYLTEHSIDAPTSADIRAAILHLRSNIGMLAGQYRSAGSFFKNTIVDVATFTRISEIVERDFATLGTQNAPWHWSLPEGREKIATAFLLECSPYNKNTYGIQRFNGVVGLSPLHSLSIVTEDGATTNDVVTFVEEIKTAVKNIFAVDLATEVDYIPHS